MRSITERYHEERDQAYANGWEHIADELNRLELLIHLRILKLRQSRSDCALEQFKGLVISEEEINGLLAQPPALSSSQGADEAEAADEAPLADALSKLDAKIDNRRAASLAMGNYLLLPHLSQLFHLTRFEERCLIICLAPELDLRYERLYAYLQDDLTRKRPTVALLLDLLCDSFATRLKWRPAFDAQAPLFRYRLLRSCDAALESPLPARALKLDDRIANLLTGCNWPDARLAAISRFIDVKKMATRPDGASEQCQQIVSFVRGHFDEGSPSRERVIFFVSGAAGIGKRELARNVCEQLKLPLVIGDAEKIVNGPLPFEDAVWLLGREALLQNGVFALDNFQCLLTENGHNAHLHSLRETIDNFSPLSFLFSKQSWRPSEPWADTIFIPIALAPPDYQTRKRLWREQFNGVPPPGIDLDALASKFRFTPGQIISALEEARKSACLRGAEKEDITRQDLYAACRAQCGGQLGALAHKNELKYHWHDIVLTADKSAQLREICNQARYRETVFGSWGFDRKLSLGRGLNVLFAGAPGTGKTMAAEVIANELQLDLYKIDLSQVVSKYIGETEKNLGRIFTAAENSNAIIFFDEADALFGKRSEVKDAHDRYANIEISYLLQKMEEYEGIVILATNLRQHMDEAFTRRMQAIIEFAFPDEEQRRDIWQRVFPREAPLAAEVDFSLLAREIKMPGGNIKNIALAAAFYAAADGGQINMTHLRQATRREYEKLGKVWKEVEGL